MKELTAACQGYKTPLKDGEAVITPAFGLKNDKAIIHSVGPDFGSTPKAFREWERCFASPRRPYLPMKMIILISRRAD